MSSVLLDAAGRRRSPATLPGYHCGRPPRNKGLRYPADPPTVEEIVAVMRSAGERADGHRARALIVVLWRAGLRIREALELAESDLDAERGAILVRRGKGGRRREVGMDRWGWERLQPWLEFRATLPVGALFCVTHGKTAGRPWAPAAARARLRHIAARAGVRRRFAPHQLRHAHAVEMAREGVPLVVIQRQLGHANLGITSVYLQGIDNAEFIRDRAALVDSRRLVLSSGEELAPDIIVLATGSSYPLPGNSGAESAEQAEALFRAGHDALAGADHVLLLGGGPVGIELAGEITAAWPGKHVTIARPRQRPSRRSVQARATARAPPPARAPRSRAVTRERATGTPAHATRRPGPVHGYDQSRHRNHRRPLVSLLRRHAQQQLSRRRPR